MKSFGTYISKHLASFAAFLLILVIVNVVLYGVTFYHTVSEDYGEASPHAMLELTSTAATTEGFARLCRAEIAPVQYLGHVSNVNGRMLLAARCATRSADNITAFKR